MLFFPKKTIAAVVAFTGVQVLHAQDSVTYNDYQRAESFLSYNTFPLVKNLNIQPHWTDENNLLYSLSENGKNQHYTLDPKTGKITTTNVIKNDPPGMFNGRRLGTRGVVSPDGRKEAFIRNYNLYVKDIATGKETQLTTDGVKDFGYATDNAGWKHSGAAILRWSPDSKKIATFQQDERNVGDMYLVSTNVGHPKLEAWKYPLPGDSVVAMIQRVIIDVDQPKVIRLKKDPDFHRGTLSDDISSSGTFDDVDWSADGSQLAFVSTSRDHKIETFQIANANTGDVKEIFQEKVKTQYESGQGTINWRYLPESKEIIWYSERDNWGHLYLYDATTGKLKNQITKGDWLVTQMLKVDEKKKEIYFMAAGKEAENPYFQQLCKINFSGKDLKVLTPEVGTHKVQFSKDFTYFLDAYAQPNVPTAYVVRKSANGEKVADLGKADITELTKIGWKAPIPVKLKAGDGVTDIYGLVFTPTHMDPNKKYPIVDYIYPGPQGGSVGSWAFSPSRGDNQSLAELGCIVIAIEGTSNPNRSKSFHDMSYGNMAINTLPDQIAAIRQLAQTYPIDTTKIGIWGHSGGGFATAGALFRYPDFFKVGISESGNHENRNYEDDWGERYNGLLQNADYASQANQNLAKNLKGKLMLVTGNMDDNVPPFNTYLVAEALENANKDFDMLVFPNRPHGYGPDSYYMMRRRWDYFVTNLFEKKHPKEFVFGK